MTKLQLLSPQEHGQLRIIQGEYLDPSFAVNLSTVMVSELAFLAHEYPLFFYKSARSGEFQLAALLGFESGQNLFLDNGNWMSRYVPLDIQRRPFQLHVPDASAVNHASIQTGVPTSGHLAIDPTSPQFSETKGESLYNDDSSATVTLLHYQTLFSHLLSAAEQTRSVIATLVQHELLEAIELNVTLKNGDITLNDLYAVNVKKLNGLTGETLQACHDKGVLQVCHLLMSSGAHLEMMIERANK
ncbi:MAG: SapC family protein [Paraglaciecola polaris]|uniref:SapC family protein n=1 Tax=Paraglaciecola polaris TaxID=222814 RepID=UPI003001AFA7|tara:strand:+ start:12441 stop:13172 length:732 start_codon:yes stop_codon:yes gene_type:complete